MKHAMHAGERCVLSLILAGSIVHHVAAAQTTADDVNVCAQPDQDIVPLVMPKPVYPGGARSYCIEGYLKVEGVVRSDGSVSDVEIVESEPPYVFDEAVRTVEGWRFSPQCEGGRSVESHFVQRIDFQFEGEEVDGGCPESLRNAPSEAREMFSRVMSLYSKHRLDNMNRSNAYQPLELLPVEPRAAGDWGVIEEHLRGSVNRLISLDNYMRAQWREIGWDRIRSPNRLKADAGLAESRRILSGMHELYQRINEMARQSFAELQAEAAALGVGAEARDLFLGRDSGEDEDVMESWEYIPQSFWDMLAENEAIIDLLAQAHGRWTVEDNQIRFHDQWDTDQFNVHLQAIEEMSQHQQLLTLELLGHYWDASGSAQ